MRALSLTLALAFVAPPSGGDADAPAKTKPKTEKVEKKAKKAKKSKKAKASKAPKGSVEVAKPAPAQPTANTVAPVQVRPVASTGGRPSQAQIDAHMSGVSALADPFEYGTPQMSRAYGSVREVRRETRTVSYYDNGYGNYGYRVRPGQMVAGGVVSGLGQASLFAGAGAAIANDPGSAAVLGVAGLVGVAVGGILQATAFDRGPRRQREVVETVEVRTRDSPRVRGNAGWQAQRGWEAQPGWQVPPVPSN